LLWAVDANAIIIIGGTGAPPSPPAGECTTQSTDVSLTSYNTYSVMYPDQERGQSWKAGAGADGKKLYSLSFRRSDSTGYDSTLTIRIGTSSNLSSTYLTEYTCYTNTTDTVFECVIPQENRPTLTGGTTYHALFRIGTYLNQFSISRDSSNPYADGTSYYDLSKYWDGTPATSDLYMVVKKCDN